MFDVVEGAYHGDAILKEMEEHLRRAEEEAARECAEVARERVHRRSGATARSIEARDGEVTVGGAGFFLEHGTHNMPAFPFLGPAFDVAAETFEKKCKEV